MPTHIKSRQFQSKLFRADSAKLPQSNRKSFVMIDLEHKYDVILSNRASHTTSGYLWLVNSYHERYPAFNYYR